MAKNHTKSIHHEYISIKQHQEGIWFRLSNYFFLLAIILTEKLFDMQFDGYIYAIVISGIVGYDIPGILEFLNKFAVGKRKKA